MRFFCGLLLAMSLVSAHAAGPALDLDFRIAASQSKVTVREMLRRLQMAAPLLTASDYASATNFDAIYLEALKHANGSQLEALAELLRALPEDSPAMQPCFSAYATTAIRRAIAQIAKDPVHLEWKATEEEMPKELADAPASFRDAWKLHRAVVAPYRALVFPPAAEDVAPPKTPPLAVDLRRVLGKPEPEAWKRLAAHTWGHTCGTGSESLYQPRNRALLLSLLADGKLHEAAGASLSQVSGMFVLDEHFREPLELELLPALGLDWEQVLFGSLLPITTHNGASNRGIAGGPFTEFDSWPLLAARGSERVIRQCLELIRWARLDPANAVQFLGIALGPEPEQPLVSRISSEAALQRTAKLPPELRREIVALLGEYLAPANSPVDLVDAMQALPPFCIGEVREPLAALVTHRLHGVAAPAHRLLEQAGLTTGKEVIAPATPPLAFRLVLNGKPLSQAEVTLHAVAAPAPAVPNRPTNPELFARPLAPEQKLTTSEDGELKYKLDECLEPERVAALQFRFDPASHFAWEAYIVPPIQQATPPPEHIFPGPWVTHQVSVRAGDERVQEIALRTADLEIKISVFPELPAETRIQLQLRKAPAEDPSAVDSGLAQVRAEAGGSGFFQRLQAGQYILTVSAPGVARTESEIAIGDTALVHAVKLEPGRDVRGTIVHPDGTKDKLLPMAARLFRDGVEVEWHGFEEWQGLPFGKYTARLPSTRETEAEAKKAGRMMAKIPTDDRVAGREVSFEINASTPETLDLGDIVLDRETP